MDLDEMKARVRAANQAGVRLDDGGDDRPPVYVEEDGRVIYRASAVGGLCDRALWLARTGVEKSPTPDALAVAYRESANNEELVLDMFTAKHYVTVTDHQKEFEVPVPGTNAVIRGHVDGIGHDTIMLREGVVEAKCIADDTWKQRKVDMYPGWVPQVQLEMKGLDKRIAWVVFGRKIDGVVEEESYIVEEYQPRVIGQVFDKIRRVEQAVEDGVPLECETEMWGCPYWQLHEGDGEEVQVVEDQWAGVKAQGIERLAKTIKDAEAQLKLERGELLEWVEAQKLGDVVLVRGRGTDTYRVNRIVAERTNTDWDAMKEDGVDVEKYQSKKKGNPYVKVTKEEEK